MNPADKKFLDDHFAFVVIGDKPAVATPLFADGPKPLGTFPGGADNADRATCTVCAKLKHDCPRHRTVPDLSGLKPPRLIAAIARDIKLSWPKVYFGAVPYLDAMLTLAFITDKYGEDDARYIVTYFLGNATSWRGDDARRLKAELKALLGTDKKGRK